MSGQQTRRVFLRRAATAVTAAVAATAASEAGAEGVRIASLSEVKPGAPVDFTYPEDELAYLVDMGRAVEGGVGSNGSLVAYSGLCQHRGCPVDFDGNWEKFVCSCHRSVFDPVKNGQCIEGPSQRGLPRVLLEIRGGDVYAVGLEGGPVFGRACSNI